MTLLDAADSYRIDKMNIGKQIKAFAADCKKAWRDCQEIKVPAEWKKLKKIVLAGMGGSGAANEAIKDLLFNSDLSIEVVHGYALPGFTDENSLVVISSYSGNTEEVIAVFLEALAKKSRIFIITTGGELLRLAKAHDIPRFVFDYPSAPRLAFPYLFSSLLNIFAQLEQLKLPRNFDEMMNDVDKVSKQYYTTVPAASNPAKRIALNLFNKVPVVYSGPELKAFATRLKTLINENGKHFAFVEFIPELHHNAVEAYTFPALPFFVIVLKSKFDGARNLKRIGITAEILKKNRIPFETVEFKDAADPLTERFLLADFSVYLSYFLAMRNGIDPYITPNINYLKKQL